MIFPTDDDDESYKNESYIIFTCYQMLYDNDKKKSKLVARELDEEELVVAAILVLQLFIRYDTNNMFFFQSQFQL